MKKQTNHREQQLSQLVREELHQFRNDRDWLRRKQSSQEAHSEPLKARSQGLSLQEPYDGVQHLRPQQATEAHRRASDQEQKGEELIGAVRRLQRRAQIATGKLASLRGA